jgi:hypothetical protein
MTPEQANETLAMVRAVIEKLPANKARPTLKLHWWGEKVQGVELWHVNPRAGNMSLHVIRDYAPELVAAHVRKAIGAATARDTATFARIAAEKQVNAE